MEQQQTDNDKSSHEGLGCLVILLFMGAVCAWNCISSERQSNVASQKTYRKVGQQVSASEWAWAGPPMTGQLARIQGGLPNTNLGR